MWIWKKDYKKLINKIYKLESLYNNNNAFDNEILPILVKHNKYQFKLLVLSPEKYAQCCKSSQFKDMKYISNSTNKVVQVIEEYINLTDKVKLKIEINSKIEGWYLKK